MRNVYGIFTRKPEEIRPLGRLRYRKQQKIKLDLKEKGWV
jgi:hypothetical protein